MLAFNFTTYTEAEEQATTGFVSAIGGAICTSGPTGVRERRDTRRYQWRIWNRQVLHISNEHTSFFLEESQLILQGKITVQGNVYTGLL
jgi:hypothetical protein